jgi:hypothetical protein
MDTHKAMRPIDKALIGCFGRESPGTRLVISDEKAGIIVDAIGRGVSIDDIIYQMSAKGRSGSDRKRIAKNLLRSQIIHDDDLARELIRAIA